MTNNAFKQRMNPDAAKVFFNVMNVKCQEDLKSEQVPSAFLT